ncbi:saccharopine dehydrogenase [Prauserella sp. PE36]|uniref:saccharopine dehydrogenase NADP-binding domain-containing protein n=1 Tax=Prauserella sp. PE36 TaxID=1504709 RepID=UPI000DE46A26|nr:saccharopine dehydrogenase NADP-binding domain-containing protein [Prauserella sp. PE36]RBM21667.1 saccharopine dehydrogenase [Prauserella sp. PE36]
MRTVLVVGGYGAVGATVTRSLAEWSPGRVVCAGRDLGRARALADQVGATAAGLDVTDVKGFERLLAEHGVGVVVLCVKPSDGALARACLSNGVHLVDVGASYHLLALTEELTETALEAAATAVLSVGLAPGLTNVLAGRACRDLGGADRIDVTVLLGAGEQHGADALRWTLTQLVAPRQRAARGPARVFLPGYGHRTAHPFPFSDQYTLRRTLGVTDVTTRLCLDSRVLTTLLFALRRTGLLRLAARLDVLRALTAAAGKVHFGSDGFAVAAEAVHNGHRVAYALTGNAQGHVTGLVAAHVAHTLLGRGLPPGVHHLDELTAFAGLPERIGLRVLTRTTR